MIGFREGRLCGPQVVTDRADCSGLPLPREVLGGIFDRAACQAKADDDKGDDSVQFAHIYALSNDGAYYDNHLADSLGS